MRRRDDQTPAEGQMIAGFAVAGAILFAGTLLVGFSAREFDRPTPPPAVIAPAEIESANSSG
jgi:hypothetical protein